MSIGLVFWMLMILWVIFHFVPLANLQHKSHVNTFLLFILLGLLGWAVFGAAIHR